MLAPSDVASTKYKQEHGRAISEIVHGIASEFAGSFSAEHGVGQLKAALLAETKAPVALDLMRDIKRAVDPKGIMNPGKVLR